MKLVMMMVSLRTRRTTARLRTQGGPRPLRPGRPRTKSRGPPPMPRSRAGVTHGRVGWGIWGAGRGARYITCVRSITW